MVKRFFLFSIVCLFFFITIFPAQAYVPSDPLYYRETYLNPLGAEKAWDLSRGNGVVVAVLDSGVDTDHPDLKNNIWRNLDETPGDGVDNDHNGFIDDISGWDFVSGQPDPKPKFSENYSAAGLEHGTAISGVIAGTANNGQGMVGLAFDSKIMPLRILDADGTGEVPNLVKAIEYAVNNGADIINLSLVGYDYSQELFDAVRSANARGVLVVAAAGNAEDGLVDGINLDNRPAYPVCYGNNTDNNLIIAVSSVDDKKNKSVFSNYGSCVDVSAFGEKILSASFYYPEKGLDDYYLYDWNGTSFATALVSGAAALVKAKNKSFTPTKITDALLSTAEDIDSYNSQYRGLLGRGLINVFSAVNYLPPVAPGRLVKLKTSNTVYYVDSNNTKHLFPNESVFWSWYSGNWPDQKIAIVGQEEMDGLRYGSNMTIRAGTNLVKFGSSNKIYFVSGGNRLVQLNEALARQLFGTNYYQRLAKLSEGFVADYFEAPALSEGLYPDGSLIQYKDSGDIYYIQNGTKRLVTAAGLAANNFKKEFVIREVGSSLSYRNGANLDAWEEGVFPYLLIN
ncbi:MAG: S8 family peptidase [Patescibacteria group bacterium]